MKELKQWDLCYVSMFSVEQAKDNEAKHRFLCMDWDRYITELRGNLYSYRYAVPVEEVEKEEKPEFKVWDYAVYRENEFILITRVLLLEWKVYYNPLGNDYLQRNSLRKPTPEELEKYFR